MSSHPSFLIKPQKPIVVYDGSCRLCAKNLRWLHHFDWFHHFDPLPYPSEKISQLAPSLSRSDYEQALHLIFPNGKIYRGADAIREIFLRMPLTFLIGIFMAIPPFSSILRKLYPVIARNRYRLGGHCALPPKK